MDKIKIAKELIKLAKSLVAENDLEKQVDVIIKKDLNSNPIKALNSLSEIVDDKEFNSLIDEVKLSYCIKSKQMVAYKNDVNPSQIKRDITTWEKFVKKLIKFISGKPRYVVAAASAILFAYLQLQVGKVTWLDGLVSTSNHASIDQFLSFLILVTTYFGTSPFVFDMVNRICQNMGYDDLDQFKNKTGK